MPPKKEFICPLHDSFEKRVEKEDDGIWDKIDEHEKRIHKLESNYDLILSNQDYFKRIMQGVFISLIIYIVLWLFKTIELGI